MSVTEGGVPIRVSVVVPTFNGESRIGKCLTALENQKTDIPFEIIVVDDGSADQTAQVVANFEHVRIIRQANAGPAAARNRGAAEASAEFVAFTDDDCEPVADWLQELVSPLLEDEEIAGVKGAYRTRQPELAARFVQFEYESRYEYMSSYEYIDFVDTYSAAFRRSVFVGVGGYNTDFPVACAEDVELSFRLAKLGHKFVFRLAAIVYHQHPNNLVAYFKKKYKFAYWRMLAVRLNPEKAISDSHTPRLMKFQVLFFPALVAAIVFDLLYVGQAASVGLVILAFIISTVGFSARAFRQDMYVGLSSPFILAGRSIAQFFGVLFGALNAIRYSPWY